MQALADAFWRRWIKEYRPSIAARTKWLESAPQLKEEDLVVVADENLPRNCWLKGVVSKTRPGADGQVRVAEIKTQNGTYIRPITRIILVKSEKTSQPRAEDC